MFNVFRIVAVIAAAMFLFCGLSSAQEEKKRDKLLALQAGDAAPTVIDVEFKEDGLNIDTVTYFLVDGNTGKPEMSSPQTRPSQTVELVFRDEPPGFRDAINAIEDGNYSQGAQALKSIEEASNSGLSIKARAFWLKQYLVYYMGYAKMMGKNSDEAIKDFERYLNDYPTGIFAPLSKIGIGRSQLDVARRSKEGKTNFTRARENFKAASTMAKAPDLYVQQAKYWLAMTDLYEGKAVGAAVFKDIQSAIASGRYARIGPYARLNLLCEVQRARVGDTDAGIKALGELIKKDEEDEATAAAYVAQGDLYRKQKKHKEAALSYLRAALLHPEQRESAAAGLYFAGICFKESKLPYGNTYSQILAGELKGKYPDFEPVAKLLFKN